MNISIVISFWNFQLSIFDNNIPMDDSQINAGSDNNDDEDYIMRLSAADDEERKVNTNLFFSQYFSAFIEKYFPIRLFRTIQKTNTHLNIPIQTDQTLLWPLSACRRFCDIFHQKWARCR